MKYPLDFENTFEKSLLFWLTRFVRNKTTGGPLNPVLPFKNPLNRPITPYEMF